MKPSEALILGVDTAGSYHWTGHGTPPWQVDAFFRSVKALGANHINFHVHPITHAGKRNSALMQAMLLDIDRACRQRGLYYTLSIEAPNFAPKAEITPGVNEYEHSGGRHFWLLRPEWLQPLLPPKQPKPLLRAVIYDEAAHMQLSNNKYSHFPKADFDKPFFVDTRGMTMPKAWAALVNECGRIRSNHYRLPVPLHTEQVWPDLFHIFARAGWTAAPKLLKEHLNAVVVSIALGAAVQYQDRGARFWVSPDLWSPLGYPGHPPESLRSALLMGYQLGAEGIYVENIDYQGPPKDGPAAGPRTRHPEAPDRGSLVVWQDRETFALTAYGKVVHQFYTQYVPRHPRTLDWRTYRPRVAIVRLPDGGWGQFSPGHKPVPHGEASSRDRLLGNPEMPLDKAASEWLHVWPILTHGAARAGAINYNNPMIYPKLLDFFMPIDSVAVFDHTVTGTVLDGVECFVVCGHDLSPETFAELARRATAGATCIISRKLYERHAKGTPPPPRWHVIDDFADASVAELLQPFLGPPDVARFRFAKHTVEFRQGKTPNSTTARIYPTRP